MTVRPIAAGEGPRLREIRLRALAESPAAFGSTFEGEAGRPAADWDEVAARRGRRDAEAGFVAESNGGWVGLVAGYVPEQAPDEVELISMWVAPEARRRGAGTALVEALIGWATGRRAVAVNLWVTAENHPARLLYERMGFRSTGDRQPLPSDPRIDELRMRRPVQDARAGSVDRSADRSAPDRKPR